MPGGEDVTAVAAGVDLPTEPPGGVAELEYGWLAEVQVPPAARYQRMAASFARDCPWACIRIRKSPPAGQLGWTLSRPAPAGGTLGASASRCDAGRG